MIRRIVLALTLAMSVIVMLQSPAMAGGRIKHYSPDDGFDDAFYIRCTYGDPSSEHPLFEGMSSTYWCADADQVFVDINMEIWCKVYVETIWVWRKFFDINGWHKINDTWPNMATQGCTVRRD